MKAVVYVIVMSTTGTSSGEIKNIPGIFILKHQAENRFDEIVVEFQNRKDEKGNFLWECESSFGYVANFKSNTLGMSFRMEIVVHEIEI